MTGRAVTLEHNGHQTQPSTPAAGAVDSRWLRMASSKRTSTLLKPISRKCRSLVSRLCSEPAERESDLDGSSSVIHLSGAGPSHTHNSEKPHRVTYGTRQWENLEVITSAGMSHR